IESVIDAEEVRNEHVADTSLAAASAIEDDGDADGQVEMDAPAEITATLLSPLKADVDAELEADIDVDADAIADPANLNDVADDNIAERHNQELNNESSNEK